MIYWRSFAWVKNEGNIFDNAFWSGNGLVGKLIAIGYVHSIDISMTSDGRFSVLPIYSTLFVLPHIGKHNIWDAILNGNFWRCSIELHMSIWLEEGGRCDMGSRKIMVRIDSIILYLCAEKVFCIFSENYVNE